MRARVRTRSKIEVMVGTKDACAQGNVWQQHYTRKRILILFSSLSGLALLGSCARVVVSATQACVIADFEY